MTRPPDAKRPPRRAAESNAWDGVGDTDSVAPTTSTCVAACSASSPDRCPLVCPTARRIADAAERIADALETLNGCGLTVWS